MPINVLLCRWADGWREVVDQASVDKYGRREAMLGLGGLQSPAEVDRVAGMQLAIFGDSRTAIAADLMWADTTDRPYRAFGVSDTITVPAYGGGTISQRVRAMTGSEDDNGEVTYSPELGDLILEEQERTLQSIKKMADGTLEGESPVAMPASAIKSTRKYYGSAPFPISGSALARIVTTRPNGGLSTSHELFSIPPGDGTYALNGFQVTPATGGFIDLEEVAASFSLWERWSGSDTLVAEVAFRGEYLSGVVIVGTVLDHTTTFAPDRGVFFQSNHPQPGNFYVEAIYGASGAVVTVPWDTP
jgi:hypothetical protein